MPNKSPSYSLFLNTGSHNVKEEKGIFNLGCLYLGRTLKNLNYTVKRDKWSPSFYIYAPILLFLFPTDTKNGTFHSRPKFGWNQTLFFKRTFNPERNAYKAVEHIGFDWQLIFLPTFLPGCTVKKSTIPHKFSIQNLFTILLDVVSLVYILRVSKKLGIHAWWHSTSGGTFKTHNKYGVSWDTLWLARKSEITSPGFLLVYIYHMMFCVLGKSFMARFLEMSA